jgi:uncharacterized protein (DUF433 family)
MVVHSIETIVSTPDICGGRPRIDGRRVTVANIAVLHNGGWDAEKIADELELELPQIYAALSYYYSHNAEIDLSIREADDLAEQQASSLQELLKRSGIPFQFTGDAEHSEIVLYSTRVMLSYEASAATERSAIQFPVRRAS